LESTDNKIKAQLSSDWLGFIKDDTPIILDLSDIAKPYAKKMDYLAMVHDGSSGKLVNGYWLVELYASLSRKNPVPVLLEPFSHQQPESPGQNPVVIKAIKKIFDLTNNRGVLVADRGFDSIIMYEHWLENKYRFVTRLVGNRHLKPFHGQTLIRAEHLAEQIPTPYRFHKIVNDCLTTCRY
jgi:hypothetical protein